MNRSSLLLKQLRVSTMFLGLGLAAVPFAANAALDLADIPLQTAANAKPRLVFAISRDQQLTKKAYNDYSDVDNDGQLDTTYKDTVNYYGYFDPQKCYTYGSSRFNPNRSVSGAGNHICNYGGTTTEWSGNFLNWAAMTRLDILRKVLYGGLRSTDANDATIDDNTILERAYIPTDAHAYVKVYNPASNATLKQFMPDAVVGAAATAISLCNVTWSTSATNSGALTENPAHSGSLTENPLIRVARGTWYGWSSNEVKQCSLRTEFNGGLGIEPQAADSGGDFIVRVRVCDSTKLEPNCIQYPNGAAPHYKPDGLFQGYGDRFKFGLVTGSYARNLSGGVLRREADQLMANPTVPATHEIDNVTGMFTTNVTSGTSFSIIKSLNKFRPARYRASINDYVDCDAPGIATINEGNATTGCSDWGNPIGEIYLEALRYLAGATGNTAAFDADDNTYIGGLRRDTSWTDPLPATEYCAKCNIVIVSTGNNSFDFDQYGSASDITGLSSAAVDTNTNTVGANESINGASVLIGQTATADPANDGKCTAKTLAGLADARGVCPEAPTQSGSYKMAGLAYYSHITDLRTNATNYPGVQNVNTFAIALAENIPSFTIPIGGNNVTIMPNCEANSNGAANAGTAGWRACSMVDLRIEYINATSTAGRLLIHWEDSTWGNDQDMDGVERLTFCKTGNCAEVGLADPTGPNNFRVVTSVPLANAGHALLLGYTITGVGAADGAKRLVLRPGGSNFNQLYAPTNNPGNQPADNTSNYTAAASTAKLLENPLWYAAKWGGFKDSDANNLPNLVAEWDAVNNFTGAPGSDGVPDSYYQVSNPGNLEVALTRTLNEALSAPGSAAAVAVNTGSVLTGGFTFQVHFKSDVWSGQVVARQLTPNLATSTVTVDSTPIDAPPVAAAYCGQGSPPPAGCPWEAGLRIKAQTPASRVILTRRVDTVLSNIGVPFTWANVGNTNQGYLNKSPSDGFGDERLDFLRGVATFEGFSSNPANPSFRLREDKSVPPKKFVLGDIVNSAPIYVAQPPFFYPDNLEVATKPYSAFRNNAADPTSATPYTRTKMLYFGANDGMLHGIKACTDNTDATCGTELVAYVPATLYPNLPFLTEPTYKHRFFVDGSPTVGDAFADWGSSPVDRCAGAGTECWRSILVGGLRAGGKSMFALDVTDPADFTTTDASKIALWEFTHADLGFTYSKATIVKVRNSTSGTSRWVAIFGNGYNSTNGKATLFIVNIADGSLLRAIDLETATLNNGLATPAVVDIDSDYIADYVYAGDLKGNMWKVDIRNADHTTWGSFYRSSVSGSAASGTPKPLFTAIHGGNIQPITTRPDFTKHPDGLGGYMVYFGTGKYLENNDHLPLASPIHSFYGIWDQESTAGVSTAAVARTALLAQTITEQPSTDPVTPIYRRMSQNLISWNGVGSPVGTHEGWYINLLTNTTIATSVPAIPNLGEMLVFDPVASAGRIIFATTVPEDKSCEAGGFSWLMEVSPRTGGRLSFDVFDLNGNGVFGDAGDRIGTDIISGQKLSTGITPGVTIVQGPSSGIEQKLITGSTGTVQAVSNATGRPSRRSWRQIK